MSKETWALIKQNKSFNKNAYRRGLTFLIFSLFLNIGLGVLISYIHLNEPPRDFYATSGVTAPIQLNPMDEANQSSQPLLDPDPPTDDRERIIPQ
ncbi:type IVB secretion system protein IcmM/DotJ [Legionella sp. km772]|uniref:type IVB secretion system protein IcmM/DotJ n=1 Tax=Legionella sp. km772 TaxID=2498111 RepID=UPI000F8D17C6|nr:type IVB secretion system protein IcmM/DotJ [Legionella sp. km772]RUR12247.1 phosphoesterase [Legionella sp. km772]